jgi:hypothetical protein
MTRLPTICGHCHKAQRGFASVTVDGDSVPLCHPDDGPDCYHLVTVYHHPMPCPDCPGQVGMLTIEQALA